MSRVKRVTHYLAATILSCVALFVGRAEACMVCIPFPEDTATEQLLRADVVVLARENPDEPFSFVAVEVLKGDLDNLAIDLFVNSTTRRRLALRPEHSVVLTLDAATNHWRSAGYAPPAYQALVREILAQAPSWNLSDRAENRATFFLPYLADADPAIHELAYLEVGRASYDTIRRADSFVPAARCTVFSRIRSISNGMHSMFCCWVSMPCRTKKRRSARRWKAERNSINTLNLSAWATALIEIDGEKAVDWLETVYLSAPDATRT